jgi:hypothetical protein
MRTETAEYIAENIENLDLTEPIGITVDGKVTHVIMSHEQYEREQKLLAELEDLSKS